jgi:hypothetical protein
MFQPLDIPPGLVRQGTPQASQGRWYDSNWVRWRQGVLRPIGGWQRLPLLALPERAYAMLSWRDNAGIPRLAIGGRTTLSLYDGSLADITPIGFVGQSAPGLADGWGIGEFGAGAFGTPRDVDPAGLERVMPGQWWSLDNWGQDLLALSTSDGVLRRWSPGDATAVAVPNAPTGALALAVTPERHVVLCGTAADPRTVSWSDSEDPETWTPTVTNLAGDLQLQTTSRPMAAVRVREGILILTEQDAHLLSWIGPPYGYGLQRIGSGCGPVGPRTLIGDLGFAAWMGGTGFWLWDGGIKALRSPVQDAVFSSLNRRAASLAHAVSFERHQEVWWFYPSQDAIEPDRYVAYCWADQTWAMGSLSRSAGASSGVWGNPLLAEDLLVQEHERGWTADGASRVGQCWAETADIQAGAGDRLLTCRSIMHDVVEHEDRVRYRFFARLAPHKAEIERGPYSPVPGYGKRSLKLSGRSIRMRVEAAQDGDWGLGRPRLDLGQGSRR